MPAMEVVHDYIEDADCPALPERLPEKLSYIDPAEEEVARETTVESSVVPGEIILDDPLVRRRRSSYEIDIDTIHEEEEDDLEPISAPMIPYVHKSGSVQTPSEYWPYPLIEVFLILDGFTLAIYRSKRDIPMCPQPMINLLGHSVLSKGDNFSLTISDGDGNKMEFHCKDQQHLDEWHDALRYTITSAPGFQRMPAESAFEWVMNYRNQTPAAPKECSSNSDMEHLSCLRDVQMNLLSSKVSDFETREDNRRQTWNNVAMATVGGLAAFALYQKQDLLKESAGKMLSALDTSLRAPLEKAIGQVEKAARPQVEILLKELRNLKLSISN